MTVDTAEGGHVIPAVGECGRSASTSEGTVARKLPHLVWHVAGQWKAAQDIVHSAPSACVDCASRVRQAFFEMAGHQFESHGQV